MASCLPHSENEAIASVSFTGKLILLCLAKSQNSAPSRVIKDQVCSLDKRISTSSFPLFSVAKPLSNTAEKEGSSCSSFLKAFTSRQQSRCQVQPENLPASLSAIPLPLLYQSLSFHLRDLAMSGCLTKGHPSLLRYFT